MPPAQDYRHNHYVPEWYQRRFLAQGSSRLHYLDLKPDVVVNKGHSYTRRHLLHWGPERCFAQRDLYTVKWGTVENVELEQFFFGKVDATGKEAVEFFTNYDPFKISSKAFNELLRYMSVQRLRTPKGLAWLNDQTRGHRNLDLITLQRIQNYHCAFWGESVWQIADADNSPTKFIISDHPVTVYNRACPPLSRHCLGFRDPDTGWVGTHTYFPLSLDRVLILSNLAWVRNPYQSELKVRPNPRRFRNSIFNFQDIQTYRSLIEEEVRQINYITKRRAYRYLAAAEKEWLQPECYLTSDHWKKLGGGYLLMPDPRNVYMGGQVYIGYEDGRKDAFSEYGHKPWQRGYDDKERFAAESSALERFKDEFAAAFGPNWRGSSSHFGRAGPQQDSEEMYNNHVSRHRARLKRVRARP